MEHEINFTNRYLLTVQEASVYFHIGEKKLREMAQSNPKSPWVLWYGNRCMFKRKKFEEYLDAENTIL